MSFINDSYGFLIFAYILQRLGDHIIYMYDESSRKKGQNEVMSFLYHFLKNILSPDVKKSIFSAITAALKIKI